jgi:hypothetical protein
MDNSSAKPPLAQVAFRSRRERTLIAFVHQEWPGLFGAIAAAIAIKVALVLSGAIPFNGDEAVLGLMARHILQGERPVFFYGQAYMGSLDAWLVAVAFRLLGESVFSIRLVQILLRFLCSPCGSWRVACLPTGGSRTWSSGWRRCPRC